MRWSQRIIMRTKEVSCYGGGAFEQHRGGLISGRGTIIGFLRGGGGAATSPGSLAMVPDGALLTLTASTGCTYSGAALFLRSSINHDVTDPAVPVAWDFLWTGTVVEAWE